MALNVQVKFFGHQTVNLINRLIKLCHNYLTLFEKLTSKNIKHYVNSSPLASTGVCSICISPAKSFISSSVKGPPKNQNNRTWVSESAQGPSTPPFITFGSKR
jgi:hypothetical protein